MKLISANYDEKTGISYAEIKHKKKIYCGKARLHPDDKNIESRFSGCRIAEIRAKISALKEERKREKEKCDEIIKFVNACKCYKYFDEKSILIMNKQLNLRIDKVNEITDCINALYKEIDMEDRKRNIVISAMKKKKEKTQ